MNTLFTLSVHGSILFLLVWILNRIFGRFMRTSGRRGWWIVLALSFLVTIPLPIHVIQIVPPLPERLDLSIPITMPGNAVQSTAGKIDIIPPNLLFYSWAVGAGGYFLFVVLQTQIAVRRWSTERLSTDSDLLNLLEDCKHETKITAPIGLILSSQVSTPALLGWLRPRILLPKDLISSLSREELKSILHHELAHFRSLDIPLNWLFTLVRVIHWFNPIAHFTYYAWTEFREEAADEHAMTSMKGQTPSFYGEVLLKAIRGANGLTTPFGSLAIGESIHNLKRRITMINQYEHKTPHIILTSSLLALMTAVFILKPLQAEDISDVKALAISAMQSWLTEIDQHQYEQSWKDASPFFQKALLSNDWVHALDSVRTPLGKCKERKLASALHQTEVPSPKGSLKGDFMVAQFNTSFENLAYAVETVTFEKTTDDSWKASGYYIKPK